MNELQIFQNQEFGELRSRMIEGEPWFVAADVCRALDIDRSQMRRLDDDEKGVHLIHTPGGDQGMVIISEPGLYSLVLGSRKPEAKAFKRWITHDVIPAIRKTGGYIAGEERMSDDELLSQALLVAQRKLEARTAELNAAHDALNEANAALDEAQPKVIFADAVAAAQSSILIGDLAKLLRQNGVQIGQKRLFEWLRNNGYLMKYGESYNMPTQKSMERKLFEIKVGTYINPDGSVRVTKTTKVSGKGQQYFINLFLNEQNKNKNE